MKRPRRSTRRGFAWRRWLLVLAILTGFLALGWFLFSKIDWTEETAGPLMHQVQRADFLHEITEKGEIESSKNVEIRCEVKGGYNLTINWLIPEGTYVKPGDLLVRLDSSEYENKVTQKEIEFNTSKAAEVKTRLELESAKIAKREYEEGLFVLEEMKIEGKLFTARDARRQAEQKLRYSEELVKKGYVTDLRVETDRIAVEKADLEFKSAELERTVLREFTRQKKLNELNSAIGTAEAAHDSAKAKFKLNEEKLAEVKTQVEKCVIKSKAAGQVVYKQPPPWRNESMEEGAKVREGQTILKLPDPKKMRVTAKVNEAKVTLLRPELAVIIRLDAMPDVKLVGAVEKIDEYPVSKWWVETSVKEYKTFIRIEENSVELKPGLTAEVRIQVEFHPEVLQVPVQAIFEHGDKHYAILRDGKRNWKAREVEIGGTNDKAVVIKKGLEEGEEVVLGAFAYRDKVELPNLSTKKKEDQESKTAIAETSTDFFKKWDKNEDGRITKEELPKTMSQMLPKIDRNDDESIDQKEWDEFEKKRKAGQSQMGSKDSKKALPNKKRSKKDESKKDESKKDESKKDESKKDESKKDESKKDESKKDESKKDESKKDESKKDESKKDESKKDESKKDESKKDESKKDESKKDESKKDESKKDESKKDESKKDESKKDESKKDESKKDESKKDESKKDESKKDESKKDESKKDESKKDESKKDESKKDESKKDESKKDESKKDESKKDESKKDESKKDESKKDESKKDESKKDESKKDESKKDESKKDESKKDESKKDDSVKSDEKNKDGELPSEGEKTS